MPRLFYFQISPNPSMQNRFTLKTELFTAIADLKKQHRVDPKAPLTDTVLAPPTIDRLEGLTTQLEAQTPFPRPILYAPNLLQGQWQLHYSNAREIRSLTRLPLGFDLREVYQVIDVGAGTFFNQAYCTHPTGVLAGYVQVNATFEPCNPEGDGCPDQRINVYFNQRLVFIQRFLGLSNPSAKPIIDRPTPPPEGRIPYLNVTYLDEDCRIGRGGEGSLFILSRVPGA